MSPSAWRKPHDRVVDGALRGKFLLAPDPIEDLRARQRARRRLDEHRQHAEVAHLQELALGAAAIDRHGVPVDGRAADLAAAAGAAASSARGARGAGIP